MGVHWYFRFAIKTTDNTDEMLKYEVLKQLQQNVSQIIIVVYINWCMVEE